MDHAGLKARMVLAGTIVFALYAAFALCIFGGERGFFATLFATHPPMEKRIERLAPQLLE